MICSLIWFLGMFPDSFFDEGFLLTVLQASTSPATISTSPGNIQLPILSASSVLRGRMRTMRAITGILNQGTPA